MFVPVIQLLSKLVLGSTLVLSTELAEDSFRSLYFHHALMTRISILSVCLKSLEKSGQLKSTSLHRSKLALLQLHALSEEFRQKTQKKSQCNIKQSLQNSIALLRSNQSNIVFTDVTYDKRNERLPIHTIRFQEAITCLINNALHANKQSKLPVHVTYYRERARCRITIRDFGPGMNSLIRRIVFLPLVSFRKSGSGLGLSFAKRVIEDELKGSLKLYSQPNQGTLVECIIPLNQ